MVVDELLALIVFGGFVALSFVVYAFSAFGIHEQSYEEAVAEQQARLEKEQREGKRQKRKQCKKKHEREKHDSSLEQAPPSPPPVKEEKVKPEKVKPSPPEPKQAKPPKQAPVEETISEAKPAPVQETVPPPKEPHTTKSKPPKVVEEEVQKREAPDVAAAAPPTQASPAKTKANTKPASGDGGAMMHQSVQSGRLLDTKQVLREKLFTKVSELHDGKADRITGMLLEAEDEDVMRMLEDATRLRQRIEGALKVIKKEDRAAFDKMGEELYVLVSEIEPIQCAKITGMLLDSEIEVIRQLLSSPSDLKSAVEKLQSSVKAAGSHRKEIGEQLYGFVMVRGFDPRSAAKITGMLLEMSDTELHQVMQDQGLLEEKVLLATGTLLCQLKKQGKLLFEDFTTEL